MTTIKTFVDGTNVLDEICQYALDLSLRMQVVWIDAVGKAVKEFYEPEAWTWLVYQELENGGDGRVQIIETENNALLIIEG